MVFSNFLLPALLGFLFDLPAASLRRAWIESLVWSRIE